MAVISAYYISLLVQASGWALLFCFFLTLNPGTDVKKDSVHESFYPFGLKGRKWEKEMKEKRKEETKKEGREKKEENVHSYSEAIKRDP